LSHAARTVSMDELEIPERSGWRRLPWIAATVGVVGVAASVLSGGGEPGFYFAWLVAVLFWLSVAIGSLFFVLVHHATKAGWGIVVRRLAENVAATIPLFAVLFAVPVYFGMQDLYHWAEPGAAAHDHLLQGKQPYLNTGFFWLRSLLYFVVWSGLALWFRHSSRQQDRTGDHGLTRRMVRASYPSLILFALTVTFAAFDWIMSLEPHWYSTIFGVYFFAGCVVACFGGLTLLALALTRSGLLRNSITVEHFHDLGKLLFTFMVFWSYIAFAQFFLIWYANIPEETSWFLERLEGAWRPVTIFLAVGHFGAPFLYLVPRTVKRRRPLLLLGAVWMCSIHLLDLHWLVMPTAGGPAAFLLPELAAVVGVGGLAVAALAWLLAASPLVPVRDPRLLESLAFENF
jgi:hypothetical protein